MKNIKTTVHSAYLLAEILSKMEINTLEDVRKFYIGINNLAAEISSNVAFIKELSSLNYEDNRPLFDGVNYILGYGQMVGRSSLFREKSSTGALTIKKVNLAGSWEWNVQWKGAIEDIQKEAIVYFHAIKKIIANHTNEEFDNKVEEIRWLRDLVGSQQEAIRGFSASKSTVQKVEIIAGSELSVRNTGEATSVNGKKETSQNSETREPVVIDEEKEEDVKIKISSIAKKRFPNIEFRFKGNRGELQLKKSGKWIDVGGPNTRTCKMVQYVLKPTSKSKKVVDIFNEIRISTDIEIPDFVKDTNQSYLKKKKIIENTVADLQKKGILTGHIGDPVFDDSKETAIINFK